MKARPTRLLLPALVLLSAAGTAVAEQTGAGAIYDVQVLETVHGRVAVHATLPSDGDQLTMAPSRPGDIPEVADAGWPALVRQLRVTDGQGTAIGVTGAGAKGWTLERPVSGSLTLHYEIDYTPLATRGWPAPREAAFADADHLVLIGRSLFITTPAQRTSTVRFSAPGGWRAVTAWQPGPHQATGLTVASTEDLSENLVAFVRGEPDLLTAGGFELRVVALGHWLPARAEVRRVVGGALRWLVTLTGFHGRADYLVVLLPQLERGGESFRASFAMTSDAAPTHENREVWGNTIAHEVFHYWNGWRLKGADYPSTQWFQEGFTEYAANLALLSGGLSRPEAWYDQLATHVRKYRQLETPLDAPGTHKGPPLYSGGALVAFVWETMLREATHDERGIGDLFRALLRDTQDGARPYAWADIRDALQGIAPGAWDTFHDRYIHGTEPLPLAEAFARVGLRLSETGDGTIRVEPDPAAGGTAKKHRHAVMSEATDKVDPDAHP